MPSANKATELYQRQRTYARLAGVLLLGAIVIAIGSGAILSRIAGEGTFAQTAARIGASERLYRLALTSVVIVTLGSTLLAFALYATLKPFNGLLAQLGMIFSLADSFLALVVRMCGFVRLHLYLSHTATGSIGAEPLSDLVRTIAGATENLGGISFGIGSCLFFYLFFKSKYIPRIISALGLVASASWAVLYCANLVFPEHHSLFLNICFPLMALAEVLTGVYLMLFALRPRLPGGESDHGSAIDAD
jgi:hypothetical protein